MQARGPNDPEWVGPFRVIGVLGQGGMGRVLLGAAANGQLVAVKRIHADLADDEGFRARFRREVDASRRVSGAYTAPVVDADADAPEPWLASLFLEGPTLSEAVAGGVLPEEAVRRLAAGLAQALADIHRVGLVHRDLKPSNIVLTADGVRVIDFGVARAGDQLTKLTHTGALVGSPAFMAPEQIRGETRGPPPTSSRSARPWPWPARGGRRSTAARSPRSCTPSPTRRRTSPPYRPACGDSSAPASPRTPACGPRPRNSSPCSGRWRRRRAPGRRGARADRGAAGGDRAPQGLPRGGVDASAARAGRTARPRRSGHRARRPAAPEPAARAVDRGRDRGRDPRRRRRGARRDGPAGRRALRDHGRARADARERAAGPGGRRVHGHRPSCREADPRLKVPAGFGQQIARDGGPARTDPNGGQLTNQCVWNNRSGDEITVIWDLYRSKSGGPTGAEQAKKRHESMYIRGATRRVFTLGFAEEALWYKPDGNRCVLYSRDVNLDLFVLVRGPHYPVGACESLTESTTRQAIGLITKKTKKAATP
ncbi:protein kinase [Streptomyces diastatochromogenes]|nr:protein kinase [Streptomyces diastatochromogenes]